MVVFDIWDVWSGWINCRIGWLCDSSNFGLGYEGVVVCLSLLGEGVGYVMW